MDLQLDNMRALITGASRGLGYAIALGLAQEGVQVAMNSRDSERISNSAQKIAEQTSSKTLPLPGDVTDPTVPARLVKQAVDGLGGIDLLITNSAGPPSGKFDSINDETWLKGIDLSLLCHVRLIRAALPYLRRSQAASVLTMTSYSVKQPIPNLVLSNSIRSATVGLTKTLALELGSEGIRFNSILPGWTKTERVEEILSFRAEQNETSVEVETALQAAESPFNRMATPEEIANVAVFLLSPAASYVTGAMLSVDGGMYKGTL